MIETTWERLEQGARARGSLEKDIVNMRVAFVAALYAAAMAMAYEGAGSKQVSEIAFRLEMQK